MASYIYGNKERLFINTSLGCSAKCKYCYLSNIGIQDISRYKAADIINEIINNKNFIKGKKGTIISLGCYSECWDDYNKKQSKELISFFATTDNYIQMATKKYIDSNDLMELDSIIQFKNQLQVYISMPTISKSNEIEVGTDPIQDRIDIFKFKNKMKKLNIVMYIKPVIPNITIKDLEEYIDLMNCYELSVVVGNYLTTNKVTEQFSDVGESLLYEQNINDVDIIYNELKKYGLVFKNSTELINTIRYAKEKNYDNGIN